jgi:cyclic pyranopterin phosphate synthase
MPAEGITLLPNQAIMQADEVFAIAKLFVKMGVNKIRLTGGEPLVRKDFGDILRQLATLPVELAVSTNAILVDQYFDLFNEIGLQKINISIDSLREVRFKEITRRDYFKKVMNNLDDAIARGFVVKVNVVLMKGFNEDEIIDFIEFTKARNVSARFIEFMPFNGNNWASDKLVPLSHIVKSAENSYAEKLIRLKDDPHDTTKLFKIDGYKGTWGVISTVTSPFCAGCNRMRLTANGKMKNCLFSNNEVDLLAALRNNEDLEPLINQCVWQKKEVRAGMDSPQSFADKTLNQNNRSMIAIGG